MVQFSIVLIGQEDGCNLRRVLKLRSGLGQIRSGHHPELVLGCQLIDDLFFGNGGVTLADIARRQEESVHTVVHMKLVVLVVNGWERALREREVNTHKVGIFPVFTQE